MLATLETHRHLYNNALNERREKWFQENKRITLYDQHADLKTQRAMNSYLAKTNFSSCQKTLRRLDHAFQAFFRRVKSGEKSGYPRFKSADRFRTVTFTHTDGCKLTGDRIYFQHIGHVKIVLHRPVEGTIKTCAFTHKAGRWYVTFTCDMGDAPPKRPIQRSTGIDLGLKSFITTSDGDSVPPHKYYLKAQAKLRVIQRSLSRKVKGSKRRAKAKLRLSKFHEHVANQRRDFHHKTARALVQSNDLIAHENLNVAGLAQTRLAKHIQDAGWSQFLIVLGHKAESAGVTTIAVDPRGTTQRCSQCGSSPPERIGLGVRTYECTFCGLIMDRDLNAAKNIHRLGCSLQALTGAVVSVV